MRVRQQCYLLEIEWHALAQLLVVIVIVEDTREPLHLSPDRLMAGAGVARRLSSNARHVDTVTRTGSRTEPFVQQRGEVFSHQPASHVEPMIGPPEYLMHMW